MSDDAEPRDEVDDGLSLTIEYLEDVIDEVKAAAAEAARDERFNDGRRDLERTEQLRTFSDEVTGLLHRWRTVLARPGAETSASESPETHGGSPDDATTSDKQYYGRVKRGTKTPEPAFREPILRVLAEAGGSLRVGECLDAIEARMGDRFNDVDRQVLASDGRTVRWRNTAQWCRNSLADLGLIDRSVRGTWAITDDGRAWLAARS